MKKFQEIEEKLKANSICTLRDLWRNCIIDYYRKVYRTKKELLEIKKKIAEIKISI